MSTISIARAPELDTTKDLSALFLKQAALTPNATALVDETKTLTYAQLAHTTGLLAKRLKIHGVGRDDAVGVLMGRSANYVIACLAALEAGGAFLVLEMAYPPPMLAGVIADAKPKVILTSKSEAGRVKGHVPLILLDERWETQPVPCQIPGRIETDESDLEKLAFISYSSGTTGKPKGIANPHRAPVLSYNLRFGLSSLGPHDRVACNVYFVWEMIRPLLRGAMVYAVSDEASYDPSKLVELLADMDITETLMTPTLLSTVLSQVTDLGARLPKLRTLWLNGEVVTKDLARRALKAMPHVRLLNCYSASETHEIAFGDIGTMLDESSSACPVGAPVNPAHTYILDEDGNRLAPGVSGELFVGGDLLAREYLGLPEVTAKAFLQDQFSGSPTARMYRTGDTARLLPSGNLEITGRVGAMIKIRGYSVVPGTVEDAVRKHLAVCECAVTAIGEALERKIVAYVVMDAEAGGRRILDIDKSGRSLSGRRALEDHVALYMIPVLWMAVDRLPTHPISGKVDLKSLPSFSESEQSIDDVSQRSSGIDVATISGMWSSALNVAVSEITQEHTLFDLGGHSLTIALLAGRYSERFGFTVPIGPLAGQPTVQGHIAAIEAARDGYGTDSQDSLEDIIKKDSTLSADFSVQKLQGRTLSNANTILLTGATGFLGGFLLRSILETYKQLKVICLVTKRNCVPGHQQRGTARLRRSLVDLGLWKEDYIDRIEVLSADLAQPKLGLSSEELTGLIGRVQVIVHAAAIVNLIYPYTALKLVNVEGTRELLTLAAECGASFHFISTNGVLPASRGKGWSEDDSILADEVCSKLSDGYGQSKWVAEQLVMEASHRGLSTRIYRFGTLSGDSRSGATNNHDLLMALIIESINTGMRPDIDDWLIETTPVDFAAQVAVSLINECNEAVVHIGDSKPIEAHKVFRLLQELGYLTTRASWQNWSRNWREARSTQGLIEEYPAVKTLHAGMPTEDGLKDIIALADPKTKTIWQSRGFKRPELDLRLLATYTRHFYSQGWIPKPPKTSSLPLTTAGPLAGRVTFITGASSGIGAATAHALAAEGSHLILAARRLDALKSLQTTITTNHTHLTVLIHSVDVTDHQQILQAIAASEAKLHQPIDILIACAGVMYYTLMKNILHEQWERTVDVNCKGLLNCLSAVLPQMLSRPTVEQRAKCHIVAISSDAGRKVFPGLGVYSASKFFVEATLQSLRLETAGTGLRVTSVQPGNTATELLGLSSDKEALEKYGEPTVAKVLDVEDVARAIVYALKQPAHVAVNEVLIEPRDEPI